MSERDKRNVEAKKVARVRAAMGYPPDLGGFSIPAGETPWTIAELVQALQAYPQDALILVEGYENGFDEILRLLPVEQAEFRPKAEEWNGSYGDALHPDDYQDNRERARSVGLAVVIRGRRR